MSEPITDELRRKMDTLGWYDEDGNIVYTTGDIPVSEIACFVINSKTFGELCDAIDSIHANLERENESLRRELDRVTGENEGDDWVKLMDAHDAGAHGKVFDLSEAVARCKALAGDVE